jgi:hypothetical protein
MSGARVGIYGFSIGPESAVSILQYLPTLQPAVLAGRREFNRS